MPDFKKRLIDCIILQVTHLVNLKIYVKGQKKALLINLLHLKIYFCKNKSYFLN